MPTSNFWQAVDRLGTEGASLTLWRLELAGDLDQSLPVLRRLPGMADRIPDPDEPRHRPWMRVYPADDENLYIAESEDSPAHRSPFDVPARDVWLMTPDWEAIRPALAERLGFNPSPATSPHSASIRQVGFSQPEIGATLPVFLHLPNGAFNDPHAFLAALHTLPECVLFVPTSRHLQPHVFAATRPRNIAVESITDRLTQAVPSSATLSVAATLAGQTAITGKGGKQPRAIIAVQPGWVWQKLRIRLTVKGTLVAKYGSARGEYSFGCKQGPEGASKYPKLFKTLFQMCVAGRWENPPRTEDTYAAVQRTFARLRELLQKIIRINGDPFRKKDGGWEPVFQFEPDRELAEMLDYKARKNANRRMPASTRRRSPDSEAEEADSE